MKCEIIVYAVFYSYISLVYAYVSNAAQYVKRQAMVLCHGFPCKYASGTEKRSAYADRPRLDKSGGVWQFPLLPPCLRHL